MSSWPIGSWRPAIILCTAAVVTAAAVQRARRMLRQQLAAEDERSRVAEVFGRYVPAVVAAQISKAGGTLPPDNREATVLFVDIEGFTSIAERVPRPGEIVEILDAYFDTVSEIVQANNGVVISFIGDAALAAFNAPLGPARSCRSRAPRRERTVVTCGPAELWRASSGHSCRHCDGSRLRQRRLAGRGRRAYTLYGDTVNLAQRLEQMNKQTGTRCLLSADTWKAAGNPADLTEIGVVRVKGRESEVAVYTTH